MAGADYGCTLHSTRVRTGRRGYWLEPRQRARRRAQHRVPGGRLWQDDLLTSLRRGVARLYATLGVDGSAVLWVRAAHGDLQCWKALRGRVEGGYRFTSPIVAVTPYVALQPQAFVTPFFLQRERCERRQLRPLLRGTNGDRHSERTRRPLRPHCCARSHHVFWCPGQTCLGALHRLGQRSLARRCLPGLARRELVVRGATPPSNLGLVSAGAELRIANGLAFAARFDGEFASSAHTLSGTAIVRYTW